MESGGWGSEWAAEESGMMAVCGGRFLIRSLQKQGVAEEWMPEADAAGLVVGGSLSDNDSMIKRTNGHGSIGELEEIGRAHV